MSRSSVSIFAIPTSERLFVDRSEEVLGGLKIGIHLRKGVDVSVHLARAEGARLAKAIAALCSPAPGKRGGRGV